MRHTGFCRLTVVNGTPRKGDVTVTHVNMFKKVIVKQKPTTVMKLSDILIRIYTREINKRPLIH